MPRRKVPYRKVNWWLPIEAFDAIDTEARRLSIKPGQLIGRVIAERSRSFYSHPIQIIALEPVSVHHLPNHPSSSQHYHQR